jgi:hypothetical protein
MGNMFCDMGNMFWDMGDMFCDIFSLDSGMKIYENTHMRDEWGLCELYVIVLRYLNTV